MTTLQRVFLVSYHAPPDPAVGGLRIFALAKFLADAGVDVVLFSARAPASIAPAATGVSFRWRQIADRKLITRAQIAIARVYRRALQRAHRIRDVVQPIVTPVARPGTALMELRGVRWHYFRIVGALDDHKWWSLKLIAALTLELARGRPSVLAVSGPPFSAVASATLFCRLAAVRLHVDFRDPWSGRGQKDDYSGFRKFVDARLEAFCAHSAGGITTTAPTLARTLERRYPVCVGRIECAMNGFDDDMVIHEPAPTGHLSLLFAGTIYYNRSPMGLLHALARLTETPGVDRSKVRLQLVGDCSSWRSIDLPEWVRSHGLDDCVSFHAPVPRGDVLELIKRCNVLVNFSQKQKEQIPAKFFEHIASRRRVLLFAETDSDAAAIGATIQHVRRADDEILDVLRALQELYAVTAGGQANEQRLTTEPDARFSRRVSNDKLVRALERSMIARRKSQRFRNSR